MMEEKLKAQPWDRDLVYMQNEFLLKTKDGRLINKKYDLVVFGGHNGLPYSAVGLLVSYPCAITAQLILDGKINERGVLTPSSDVVIDTVLKVLEKEKVFVFEEKLMQAKF
jgi:saccharopine dehydrogenase (NADP+, L-glutamate forming)